MEVVIADFVLFFTFNLFILEERYDVRCALDFEIFVVVILLLRY